MIAVLSASSPAAAPPADSAHADAAKAKLAALRARIAELTGRMASQLAQRDSLSARVRETELGLAAKRQRVEEPEDEDRRECDHIGRPAGQRAMAEMGGHVHARRREYGDEQRGAGDGEAFALVNPTIPMQPLPPIHVALSEPKNVE